MRRNIVIAAVTAAALIGGGTATALATTGDDGRGTAPRADVSVSDDGGVRDEADGRDGDGDRHNGPGASSAKVTAAEAIAAALRDTPGTAVSAELDDADDADDRDGDDDDRDDRRERAAWEVDVLSGDGTWHSVRVDPASGKVLGSHADAADDADDDEDDDAAEARAALKGASVTAAEAAQAAAGKGTVTSVDLDDDGDDDSGDGADRSKAAWEVETRASGQGERDWRVDLKTGEVTADRDDDGSRADDADDRDGSGSDDADDSDDD
ncbi:PepSY domain-containing protein [Streptomyces sp. A13(2022)]|uniref:PepSY domain-containing protein n=1 Tax=Streptomyces sp. A13(2022) TaxID=2964768 RepID=UPI0021D9D61D|nr:PepSY domain-containing protein [Streptomyces sp. A13(2022)]MCU8590482.1 PepSY domain-containing protein [Streptomyces sp. A13(2022)]